MIITKRNLKYFNHAAQVATLSDFVRHHIGCVVVYKNHILSVGYNTNKTHPLQMEYNRFRNFNNPETTIHHKLHAECMALFKIRDLDIDWRKVEIYICRKDYYGNLALSAPCPACLEYIKRIGIRDIFYTGYKSLCCLKLN